MAKDQSLDNGILRRRRTIAPRQKREQELLEQRQCLIQSGEKARQRSSSPKTSLTGAWMIGDRRMSIPCRRNPSRSNTRTLEAIYSHYGIHCVNCKAVPYNARRYPRWDGSEAERRLKIDIYRGEHRKMEPRKLRRESESERGVSIISTCVVSRAHQPRGPQTHGKPLIFGQEEEVRSELSKRQRSMGGTSTSATVVVEGKSKKSSVSSSGADVRF